MDLANAFLTQKVTNIETITVRRFKINIEGREVEFYQVDCSTNTPDVPYGSAFNVLLRAKLVPVTIPTDENAHDGFNTRCIISGQLEWLKRPIGSSLVDSPAKKGLQDFWDAQISAYVEYLADASTPYGLVSPFADFVNPNQAENKVRRRTRHQRRKSAEKDIMSSSTSLTIPLKEENYAVAAEPALIKKSATRKSILRNRKTDSTNEDHSVKINQENREPKTSTVASVNVNEGKSKLVQSNIPYPDMFRKSFAGIEIKWILWSILIQID